MKKGVELRVLGICRCFHVGYNQAAIRSTKPGEGIVRQQ